MTKVDTTQSDGEIWDADTTPASSGDVSMSMSDSSEEDSDTDDLDAQLGKGALVGRYRVIERLGAGGMGVVYRAHDPQLDREVALKLLRSARSGEQVSVLRMLREAKSAAKIRHPNVVTVYDAGEIDGHVFIAMELMRGTDLSKWFGRRPAWRDVVRVMLQAAQGLRAAHVAGLIHRDFKPDNVVLEDDGNVKVLDFGLARTAYDADAQSAQPRVTEELVHQLSSAGTNRPPTKLTRTGALMGTVAYMAPEQYEHQPLDSRTDQFSFCVTLFMGVYGYRPFGGNTGAAVMANIRNGKIEEPEDPSVAPTQLLEVLRKGLARNPNDRFSSMDEIIAELQAILNRDAGRSGKPRVSPWTVLTGLSIVVVAAAVGLLVEKYWGRDGGVVPDPALDKADISTSSPSSPSSPIHDDLSLELAAGRGRNKPVNGPQIWISADTLRVIATDGGPHHDIALNAGRIAEVTADKYTIAQVVEALETVRPKTEAAAYDPVTLYVDRRTPFSTIVRTVFSGGKAGFLRYDFAVQTNGETRVLEVKPQTYGDGDAKLRRVAIELGIQQDRIRVGARAWAPDDHLLDREPTRWPLDVGAGSCELNVEAPASVGLEPLSLLSKQLCQLNAVSIAVVVSADDDVPWEQVANALSAALPSAECSSGIVIEAGMQSMPDCGAAIAVAELGTKLESEANGGIQPEPEPEPEFRRWCFRNSNIKSKKVCLPTQAECIREAGHWVDHPRRSCRGEQ
jgi:serine/threonine protein kinase